VSKATRFTTEQLLRAFERYRRRAEREARDPERVGALTRRARKKLKKHRPALRDLRDDLPTLTRLARAWARGEYRAVPWKSVVLTVGALLYFVSPADLIPDFIPVLGYLDDAAVVAYVVRAIRSDLHREERALRATKRSRGMGYAGRVGCAGRRPPRHDGYPSRGQAKRSHEDGRTPLVVRSAVLTS
jgi:uncharacterized membrane protein YkvA (DUF1232 family)